MDEISKTMQLIKDKLIPDLFSFVIQLSSFIVLLLVVFFVAYKPVKKMLQKRADHIEDEIKQAEENHALALEQTSEAKQILAESKTQASEIIADATKQGEKQYALMIEEAAEDVKEMKRNAEKDIERAKQEALQDIHDEMVNVALSASKEILKREVSSEDNTRLAEDFINRLN